MKNFVARGIRKILVEVPDSVNSPFNSQALTQLNIQTNIFPRRIFTSIDSHELILFHANT